MNVSMKVTKDGGLLVIKTIKLILVDQIKKAQGGNPKLKKVIEWIGKGGQTDF